MGSKKTKTKNEPWAPAQPYILRGMEETMSTFDRNQPRLQDMSDMAYAGARALAPSALAPSPYVSRAQSTAQSISDGRFLNGNPGQGTYDRLQQPATGYAAPKVADPSMGLLDGMARNMAEAPGSAALRGLSQGGANPADSYASAVARGQYLNAQPSAGLYSTMMGADYLNGNPYLDSVIAQTNADVTKNANRLFASRGMGPGAGSAFADVLSKNLANNEGMLRYQNYSDAANRQLQAAGQSDSAWSGERGRMDASTGLLASNHNAAQDRALSAAQALNQADQQNAAQRLAAAQALGTQFNAGEDRAAATGRADADRALQAAQASDAARSDQVAQMLQALGLTGGLRDAEYAGVAPTLSLLNTAGDLPYVGVGALNGNIRTASNGYGVQTTKQSGGLGGVLGSMAGTALNSFAGGYGQALGSKMGT